MSSYINIFLKTEITCIPRILRKYAGDYYNNTAGNAGTWLFFTWCFLHCIYNSFLKAFFKRMRCKGYINDRLRQSLWYLGFYSAALIYCGASLIRNQFIDDNYRVLFPAYRNTSTTNDLIIGFMFLITFYVHTSVWECFIVENFLLGLNYLLLVLATITAYFMRSVETAFGLSVIISAAHVGIELARIVQLMASYDSKANMMFTKAFFAVSLFFVLAVYAIALPLSILLPLGLKILEQPSTCSVIFFIFCMMWLAVEVISSPMYRLAEHWIFHTDTDKINSQCSNCFVECALFEPRNDVVFTLKMYRQQMKEDRERMMSMRKPKTRNNMLVQTLKCMVAIRRKINRKRLSESSDSDESQKSESEPKDEVEIKEIEEDSDSDEEISEHQEVIEEINNSETEGIGDSEEVVGDSEEIVDGKLQIRVREKKDAEVD